MTIETINRLFKAKTDCNLYSYKNFDHKGRITKNETVLFLTNPFRDEFYKTAYYAAVLYKNKFYYVFCYDRAVSNFNPFEHRFELLIYEK